MISEKLSSSNAITPEEPTTKDVFDLMVASIADESDPLLQLDNLYDISELLKITHLDDGSAKALFSTLEVASAKDDNTPLVSLSLDYLKDCVATDYLHDGSAEAKISKNFIDDLQNQEQLHRDYPALPGDDIVVRLAPGIAYSLDDYHRIKSTAFEGAVDTVSKDTDPQKDPFLSLLGQDNDMPLWMINFAHDVRFRGLLEDELGLDLARIPLDSQIQLLKFMAKADDGRFDRLCKTLHNIPDERSRLKLAESFLAADFGEDFGDSLLTIANSERLSGKEKEQILDKISSCRKSIQGITSLYEDFDDGNFSRECAKAANERLTDIITVFEKIAENGSLTVDLDRYGKAQYNFESAMEALEYEAKSLEVISGTLEDVKSHKDGAFAEVVLAPENKDSAHNRTLYNFYSPEHGYVLLRTRPEGSGVFDEAMEYGRHSGANVGTEASMSFMTNPVDPFLLPSPFKPNSKAIKNPNFYDSSTMNRVSAFRLDREGRAPGSQFDDANRSPVNPVGVVSVDLAAIGDRSDTPSGSIARLISAGSAMRGETKNMESSLNHNTRWFDQDEYGTDEGFRRLVEHIDTLANGWCEELRPEDNVESFSKLLRDANRARGRKVSRVA